MKTFYALAAAVGALAAVPSFAATTVNISVEGGGTPIVYQGSNGDYYAVLGLDSRGSDSNTLVDQLPTTIDLAYISSHVTSGAGRIVNAYFDATPNAANEIGTYAAIPGLTVNDESRLWNSVLLEFTGTGNIVFSKAFGGGTTTLGFSTITRGAPPLAGEVPEPASWAMMIVGFGAVGATMRRRNRKAVVRYA